MAAAAARVTATTRVAAHKDIHGANRTGADPDAGRYRPPCLLAYLHFGEADLAADNVLDIANDVLQDVWYRSFVSHESPLSGAVF